ncbi:ligand-binding sensor domain-containing diguanylate cyclase [Rubrivivax rivuli]|uniref:diguanylate cyclase n=1 Tax=Rubrivivax rivuli TaxID=1862385 RepID=A0A437R8D7_9BURK|nr:ligand-binding sensor domain-containing diguanylate cyclase [Rubrivivax rivuli]RVU43056.1 GGDEF domain-containing protein [Rubrivivax rivuli]
MRAPPPCPAFPRLLQRRSVQAGVRSLGRALALLGLWGALTALAQPTAAAQAPQAAAPAAPPSERWQPWAADGFKHLGPGDGLPNDVSIALAEDALGFLWVGTMGGVARWDGYQFTSHVYRPGSPGLLPDNVVQTLFRDASGRLWAGTNAAGLVGLPDPRLRAAQPLRIGVGPQGLVHGSVRALSDDGRGGLWVATDGGLDHLHIASGRVQRVPMGPTAANGLRGDGAVTLLRDRRNRLWVGTTQGLFVQDGDEAPFREVALPDALAAPGTPREQTQPPRPESLLQDSAGRLWVGTNRHGVFVMEADGQAFRPLMETQRDADGRGLATRRVVTLIEARPGEIWAGTLGQGVVVIHADSGRTRRLVHRPLLPSSLPDDHVRALLRDSSGLVWAATYSGLGRLDPNSDAVLNVTPRVTLAEPQAGRADYAALMAHSDGSLWLGTLSQGVEVVEPDTGRMRVLRPDARRPEDALPLDATVSLVEAADGSVYIGNYRGLYRARPRAGQVPDLQRIRWPGRPADAGIGPLVRQGQRLWIGGLSDGLWAMDLASGRVEHVLKQPQQQLTDHRISALAVGPKGALWIGTRNGLNRYDPGTGEVQRIAASAAAAGAAEGLAGGFVAALHTDRRGRLWVATYGAGLHLLTEGGDGQAPARFRRWGMAQGLPDDNTNALLEDDAGRLWVSTDSGLAVVDPETGAVRALRRAEGVAYGVFWTNAATRTAAGELLFGASGGLSVVRPNLLQAWRHRPAVVVSELRVDGRPQPLPPPGEPLVLLPPARSLEVAYAALDYSAPERNRYAHRLVGLDKDWVETDARRRLASYSNLPPGEYRLQMRGSNRDGVFSEQPATLLLRVEPAWHQTLWFRLLAGLALLGLVYGLVHARTRLLQTRRVQLQHLVHERTLELQALSQALSEKSRALEEKSRVLERASISDPLTGLHNRRFLTEHIEAALAASLRRAQTHVGEDRTAPDTDTLFLLIDVDHFKAVNDEHGHAAGDAVLVQLAQRLRVVMRESDELVRWGGEEFLAVARDTDRARADELAERIRAGVAEAPFRLPDGRALRLSVSIGHACWPFIAEHPQALDWNGVVNVADMGLLAAKRLGRNAWVGLQASPDTPHTTLAALVRAMPQQAVQQGRLRLSSSHDTAAAARALSQP